MSEIKCPKCGEIFDLKQSDYDAIAQQVRNEEFSKQVRLIREEIQARAEKEIEAEKAKYLANVQDKESIFAEELKRRDEQIEYLRNFRLTLSTKMLGESLEQHCAAEFEALRALAFQTATFEKDNDSKSTGTKGDFIFRDFSEEGVEFISIMFEMKNEAEDSTSKHKNEDFFKKLDKDRTDKGCEYAVLVSMLEPESELYNRGIVDVSYSSGYPKMYVIRPQLFIPMITILRNAALETIKTKTELAEIQRRNIDITNFESALLAFREDCAYNYEQAEKKFNGAIAEIDKAIETLKKVKDGLLSSSDNLRIASGKADKMTIRKLTSKSPSLREEFKRLEATGEENRDDE